MVGVIGVIDERPIEFSVGRFCLEEISEVIVGVDDEGGYVISKPFSVFGTEVFWQVFLFEFSIWVECDAADAYAIVFSCSEEEVFTGGVCHMFAVVM